MNDAAFHMPTADEAVLSRAADAIFADWDAPARPGGYVAVIRKGQLAYLRAFGMPCLEQPAPWRVETRLRIYAITMSMTAMATLIAEDRGLLGLDDDVRRHLPDLPDYGLAITLRHLLDHSSGLRDNEMVQFMAGFVRASPCSIEYTLELIRRQRGLNFPPGAQSRFSNTNYRLLALVLERVSGMTFAQWMMRTLFEPLGMTDSLVVPVDGPIVPNLAFGYTPANDGGFWHIPNLTVTTGDGGVISSIRDLAIWCDALRTNPLGIGRLTQRMTSRRRFGNGRLSSYGLGVRMGRQGSHAFIGHGGEYFGYCSEYLHFPDAGLSVVALANFLDPGLEARIHRVAGSALGTSVEARSLPPRDGVRLAGWYANAELPLVVAVEPGSGESFEPDLQVSAVLGGLVATAAGGFEAAGGYASTTARFVERPGRRPLLEIDGGDGPVSYSPVSPEFLPPAALFEFAGLYGSQELNAVHRVYARDGRLLHLRGLGEWPEEQVRELTSVGPDLFVLDYREGEFTTVRFERNRRQRIVAMTVANRDLSATTLSRLPDPISKVAATEHAATPPAAYPPQRPGGSAPYLVR